MYIDISLNFFPVKNEVQPGKTVDTLFCIGSKSRTRIYFRHKYLLDRGIVKENCPSILAVETQVENAGKKSLQNLFLDLEDETGGLSTIADPDKFVNFSATLKCH